MAVALEFIDLLIPVALIREKYPGGLEACAADHERLLGRRVWLDEHLFRDGALTLPEIDARIAGWAVLGFKPWSGSGASRCWSELCVVDLRQGGPTMPCAWLAYDADSRIAWYTGTARGAIAGPTRRAAVRRDDLYGPISIVPEGPLSEPLG